MAVAHSAVPVSKTPRQADVLEQICVAIREGRDKNGDWSFPSDCICCESPDGWHYQYNQDFLDGLKAAVKAFTASYVKPKSPD